MDDDNDPSNWILVEVIDCSEENKNQPVTSNTTIQESDHESDSSISIISFPNDSFSEEDTLICTSNDNIKHNITNLLMENKEQVAISEVLEGQNETNQTKDETSTSTSSTSEISAKQWTFIDDKSKLQLDIKEKPFFLDCSQEPILEISDIDTESTSSGPECKALVEQGARHISVDQFILSRNGMFIFFTFLCISVLLKSYVDHIDADYYPASPILDNIPATDMDIVKSCIQEKKTKTTADGFIERCVIKHLNKKKRDIIKNIKLYLEIHEWILEKKIKEKEYDVFKKWKKIINNDNFKKENLKEQGKNAYKYTENNKVKRKYLYVNNSKSDELNKMQMNKKLKNKKFHQKVTSKLKKEQKCTKHFKLKRKHNDDKIYDEAELKDEFKHFFSKVSLKNGRSNKRTAEWYVKYNPVANDIEIINITNLLDEKFVLINNDNKTLNGLWYFKLYGLSRPNIRKMGIYSNMHMVNQLRKNSKAKWYFEYMTARDHYRHVYSSVYDF